MFIIEMLGDVPELVFELGGDRRAYKAIKDLLGKRKYGIRLS